MKISIAMATYNGSRYLGEQLESFAQQDLLPDELVVCDDRSSDATLQILQEFRAAAPFEVLVHANETTLGFTANFSRALAKTTGDIVFLADQDDFWSKEKIAVIADAFAANRNAHLLVHDAELSDEDLRGSGTGYLEQVVRGYGSSRSLATGALTAVRRELLRLVLPVPTGIQGHDIWLHDIAHMVGARQVIPRRLQRIRRHRANTSAWVASSLQPIDRVDVWKSQFKTLPATDYSDRMLMNEKSAETLQRILSATDCYSRSTIEESLCLLARERAALGRRDELAKSSWLRRKALSFRMLWTGDYRHFNGYRSFLRDLAR